MVQSLWKTLWQFLKKLSVNLPYNLAMPLVGIYPREMKTHVHTKTLTWTFIAALFKKPQMRNSNVHQLVLNRQTKQCIHTMGYFSTTKRNKLLVHATARMNLKNFKRSERSQKQKTTSYIIPYMRNIQQRQIYRQRADQWLLRAGAGSWSDCKDTGGTFLSWWKCSVTGL